MLGWIAAISLAIAGVATIAHTTITSAESEIQKARLEKLLDKLYEEAEAEQKVRISDSQKLQQKQNEIDELRSKLLRITEPTIIYSQTIRLSRDGEIDLSRLPALEAGDLVKFTVHNGQLNERRKNTTKIFGKEFNLPNIVIATSLTPKQLVLRTTEDSFPIDMQTKEVVISSKSSATHLEYSLPSLSKTIAVNTYVRDMPRIDIKVSRAVGE